MNTRWREWMGFGLGLWLAASPWSLGYAADEAATANAAFVGLVLALGSHFEVSFEELSAEWLHIAAGAWLLAAPFTLGFVSRPAAAANSMAVGGAVAALALSALAAKRGEAALSSPRRTA